MSSAKITLPVPINVQYKKQGSRSIATVKAYNEVEFPVPSFSMGEVTLVAQWCQPWHTFTRTTSSDIDLVGGDWPIKLAQSEHMVALIAVEGEFYAPLRAGERAGGAQHLVTAQNALSVLSVGLKTMGPFTSSELYPQHLGFNLGNYGVTDGRPFAETGLLDGEVLVGTDENERLEQIGRYLERNFIVVEGLVFTKVDEPRIVVRPRREKVSVLITPQVNDHSLAPVLDHYFRIDECDRALQMIEGRWPGETIVEHFSDLKVTDPGPLANNFEMDEALRLSRRYFDTLAPVLRELDWGAAEPWYGLKKLLRNPSHNFDDVEEMISLVEKSANALATNSEIDEEWREKTVLYARLGVERWTYRPITFAGPRI